MEIGTTSIGRSGAVSFTPNKFSQPPVVICQILRNSHRVFSSDYICIYIIDVNKDSFSYVVKGNVKFGDQMNWVAISI